VRLSQVEPQHDEDTYLAPSFHFSPVTDIQIHHAISRLAPYKAPGADGISNSVLIRCTDLLVPHLGPIYCATFSLETYPDQWKNLITAVLRKPGKPDYTRPNAHHPIALINMLDKVLSACIVEDIVHMAEIHKTLPDNHFGVGLGGQLQTLSTSSSNS